MKNSNGKLPGNAGQIVKEFLIKNADMSNLYYKGKENEHNCSRRKRRKMKGTIISIPCDPTNENVKNELKEMVNDGKYKYEKTIINEDLSLAVKEIHVDGRKNNLF